MLRSILPCCALLIASASFSSQAAVMGFDGFEGSFGTDGGSISYAINTDPTVFATHALLQTLSPG